MLQQNFGTRKSQFPIEIDVSKVHECRETAPPDTWNWMKFKNTWYRKHSPDEIVRLHRIKTANREFPHKHFTCLEDIAEHYLYLADLLLTPTVQCDLCDYRAEGNNASFRVEQHRGGKRCITNQKRLKAKKNCENYVPDSEKPAYCGLCKKAFANKYTLLRHETNDNGHKEKLRADPLPTMCSVCKHDFNLEDMLSCKRHLKLSKKCHRQIYNNDKNRIKWLYLHSRFCCNFDKNKILEGMRITFETEKANKEQKAALRTAKKKERTRLKAIERAAKKEQIAVQAATKAAAKLGVKVFVKIV